MEKILGALKLKHLRLCTVHIQHSMNVQDGVGRVAQVRLAS